MLRCNVSLNGGNPPTILASQQKMGGDQAGWRAKTTLSMARRRRLQGSRTMHGTHEMGWKVLFLRGLSGSTSISDLLLLLLPLLLTDSIMRDRPSTTYTVPSFQGDLQQLTTRATIVKTIGKISDGNAIECVGIGSIRGIRGFRGRRGPASRDTSSNGRALWSWRLTLLQYSHSCRFRRAGRCSSLP